MARQHRFILLFSIVAFVGGVGSPHSRAADPADKVSSANEVANAADIARWIGALDDNRYLAREEATQHLIAAGSAALDPLLAVANSDQPEPADRAIWILRRLGNSRDNDLGVAALEHLAQLKAGPLWLPKPKPSWTIVVLQPASAGLRRWELKLFSAPNKSTPRPWRTSCMCIWIRIGTARRRICA